MKYGSVCSGIEAASVAWHPLGWKPAFFSEIDKFPRKVLVHRFPDVPCHGDFTTIGENSYDPIDLLVGGTPCQAFSVAGLRKGFSDERGNLTLEFIRLAERLKPRWLVWENVPGVLSQDRGRAFGAFLGGLGELGYGVAYRVLDAQYFGVPQRRRRVFVVGYLGDWRPAAAVLFERESLRGDPAPSREARQGTPCAFETGPQGGGFTDLAPTLDVRCKNGPIQNQLGVGICATFQNTGHGYWQARDVAQTLRTPDGGGSLEANLVAHTLKGEGHDASEDGTGRGVPLVPMAYGIDEEQNAHEELMGCLKARTAGGGFEGSVARGMSVRRLTPRECERLQGFPDDFTAIPGAADGPRYKALGNSMAVPVMAWIGKRIQMVEETITPSQGGGA